MKTPAELALSKEYINLIIADHLCLPIAEVVSNMVLMATYLYRPIFILTTLTRIAADIGMEFDIDIHVDVYGNWVTVGDVEKYINSLEEM